MADARTGLNLAWVTGATSFLGRHVARALAASGHSVIGFARTAAPDALAADWGFRAVELGPFKQVLLERALVRFGTPRVVFHAIGSGSVGQALADPKADAARTVGTLECLGDALRKRDSKVRLIYPSSAAVYGDADTTPIAETAPPQPISTYGINKLAAEEICRQLAARDGLEIVILRLFSVFGSPQRKLLFWDVARRIHSGERIITLSGTGRETRDFIHVTDAARAVAILAEVPDPPLLVNVGSGRATSIETVTAILLSELAIGAKVTFSGVTRPSDPPHQQADISRLRSLGFVPRTELAAGLNEYANWLLNDGREAAG
jgi:UDP-glucose 4-epimerase